jgi:quercetin dioxygenase-like cupin family protein
VSATKKGFALFALLVGFAIATNVHAKAPAASTHSAAHAAAAAMPAPLAPDEMKWGDNPDLPGVKVSVLRGDPASKGYYALRIDMPDGFRIPPHWHPTDEHVTVISGTFHVAMGDQFDNTKGASLPPGGFAVAPALMHHYAWADGETIVQVDGIGPFKINWVNAADDPKNKKP